MPFLPISILINFSWANSHNFFIMEKSKFTLLFNICWNWLIYSRGWCPKFAPGLNIKIGIVQKVYEWAKCPFSKLILQWGDLDNSFCLFWYLAQEQILGITLYIKGTIHLQIICGFMSNKHKKSWMVFNLNFHYRHTCLRICVEFQNTRYDCRWSRWASNSSSQKPRRTNSSKGHIWAFTIFIWASWSW